MLTEDIIVKYIKVQEEYYKLGPKIYTELNSIARLLCPRTEFLDEISVNLTEVSFTCNEYDWSRNDYSFAIDSFTIPTQWLYESLHTLQYNLVPKFLAEKAERLRALEEERLAKAAKEKARLEQEAAELKERVDYEQYLELKKRFGSYD